MKNSLMYIEILLGVVLVIVLVSGILMAFEATLDTPEVMPPVTKKILNRIQFVYNYQGEGGQLAKTDVRIYIDHWNTAGETPFIIDTILIEKSGSEFFDGNVSTAAEIKSILQAVLIAEGEITAEDEWL